jgi:hypothetical protein
MSKQQHHQSDLPSTNPSSSFWLSEPSSKLLGHRTTKDLPQQVDVAVVGSGISGVSVLYHLLEELKKKKTAKQKTMTVLVLEAREVCWGATGR